MRILEVFTKLIPGGGIESLIINALRNMDKTGMEIDCLTIDGCQNKQIEEIILGHGGSLYNLNIVKTSGLNWLYIKRKFNLFFRKHKYDVVHIHSGYLGLMVMASIEADKSGVKNVIVHSHAAMSNRSFKHDLIRRFVSFPMAKHVDAFCACSQAAADWNFEPQHARNALIITNGIDLEQFAYRPNAREHMRKKLGVEDKYVIGHVGRFSEEKNHPFLIRIFEKVLEKDKSCHLLLLGDGEDRAKIEGLIEEKGLTEYVTLTGNVNNVSDYLQAMDIFVLPSLYEGLPFVALEAQAAGLPVVLSDTVTRETKIADEVCFLSLNDDPSVWADEILSHKNAVRPDNRAILTEAGYSIQHTAEQLRELYLE